MGAGFAAVKAHWMASADLRVLGRFVAQCCVPALLFRAISKNPLDQVMHPRYLLAFGAGSLLSLGLVWFTSRKLLKRPLSLAAFHGLGAANSNSAFVGFPIVSQVVGPLAAVALALNTLVENLLIIPLALALSDADAKTRSKVFRSTAHGLLRNPMVLAIAAGFAVSASGLQLPSVLDRAVGLAAAAAPPTALFVIGGSLVGLKLTGLRTDMALVAGAKLLLHPLCVGLFLWLLPPAEPVLVTAALLFAAMPMLSIYPVLAQRHGHEQFCAAALLAATVGSFFTLTALIALLPPSWYGH